VRFVSLKLTGAVGLDDMVRSATMVVEEETTMSRVVDTLRKVAEHYRVKPQTVTEWKKVGMPGRKGAWDLDQIDRWRVLRQSNMDRSGTLRFDGRSVRDQHDEHQDRLQAQMNQAKARSLAADAAKKEAEARIKQLAAYRAENADVVELPVVENFLTQLFSDARKRLQRIEKKAQRFGPAVQRFIRQEIELTLHGIHKDAERLVDLREDE
jgi:hypothetical protein